MSIQFRQQMTSVDDIGRNRILNPSRLPGKKDLCRWVGGTNLGGDVMFLAGGGLKDTGVIYQEKSFLCFYYMKRLSLEQYITIVDKKVKYSGSAGDMMIRP